MPGSGSGIDVGMLWDQTSPRIMCRLSKAAVLSVMGLAMTDLEGRIQWMNPAFTHLTGLEATDVLERHPFDALLGFLKGSAELRRLRDELAAGREATTEFAAVAKDGTPYWLAFSMSPGNTDDIDDQYYLVVLQDVTERRRVAEEARRATARTEAFAEALRAERELLASVLSTIPHIVFWKDTDHRYLGCNDAYARLRGLESEAQLVGRSETELNTDPLGVLIAEIEGRVLSSGIPVVDQSIAVVGADAEPRKLVLSVLPRYADGPEPGGVIGVGADVTRVTALERQLAQATRLESIGQLAAGLAHEINTPIQYVSDNALFLADSFKEVLEALSSIANATRDPGQDPLSERQTPTVDDIRRLVDGVDLEFLAAEIPDALAQTLEGVGRVADIIRAMKEFSHPGQGRVDTDLHRVVESTVQVSRNEWKYVAEMHLDLDPDLGLVPCYEGELKQVLLNLIVNAAHTIADQRELTGNSELGRIGIAARRLADTIQISVSDTGTGMDEKTKQRIFDPFFTTKEVGKGTGQGLSMAHSCIVGKHEGSIDVITAPGAGTTFQMNLPATVKAVAAEAQEDVDGG